MPRSAATTIIAITAWPRSNSAHRARSARPGVEIVTIQSYLGDPALDALSERLTERTTTDAEQ